MSKFLLLLGPSGVGKSSVIEELIQLDNRFVYISPFVTRTLREGEKNKFFISSEEIDEMWNRGELVAINDLYGTRYATPRLPILEALTTGKFPVLDWPLSRIGIMMQAFPGQLCVIYILPPSIESLERRLSIDGRDIDGHRLQSAYDELKLYKRSRNTGICDFEIIAEENQIPKIAQDIHTVYLRLLHNQP